MVQKVRTNSSNEHFNNQNDSSRFYDMEANVHIENTEVNNFESGVVSKDANNIATFNSWDKNHLNIVYMGVTLEERNEINIAVDAFINEVKESVANR